MIGGQSSVVGGQSSVVGDQSSVIGDQRSVLRHPLRVSAFRSFSVSGLQHFSVSLFVWLLLVEGGTVFWYRSQESRLPRAASWSVELPRDNATFRESPLSEAAKGLLRPDEVISASWTETGNLQWRVIYLRWNPGRVAGYLAALHTPQICMPGAGFTLKASSPVKLFASQGVQLPFRGYTFEKDGFPIHVFYCRWEDRPHKETSVGEDPSRLALLRSVWTGRITGGQRVLEVAIRGAADQQEAEGALARELDKIIISNTEKPKH